MEVSSFGIDFHGKARDLMDANGVRNTAACILIIDAFADF